MKAQLHALKSFPVLAIALLATLTAAGCSSGPDIKPPSPARASQSNSNLALEAALNRQLVEVWQARANTQQVVGSLGRSLRAAGCDTGKVAQVQDDLQNAMQTETREFTVLSNLMKTKQDTEKSAVNNVR